MWPCEEVTGRHGALAVCGANLELGVERDDGRGQLGPGRGEGERAADRASMARGPEAREPSGGVKERLRLAGHLAVEQRLLPGESTDPKAAVRLGLDPVESRNTVDVDDERGLDDARLQHRHEALTAREHPRSVPVRKQRKRLLERLGRAVGERGRLHAAILAWSSGRASFALPRYSIVVKIRSSSPAFARS